MGSCDVNIFFFVSAVYPGVGVIFVVISVVTIQNSFFGINSNPHCFKSLSRSAVPLKYSGISAQLQQGKGVAVVPASGPQTLDKLLKTDL